VQAVLLVLIGVVGRPLPRQGSFLTGLPLTELMLAMAVLAVASLTMGLLISAVVNSSDKTMPLLVVVVLAQVVLSGGVFPVHGKTGLEQFAWLAPARWGYGAMASTSNLNVIAPGASGTTPDPLWNHTPHIWLLEMVMQAVLAAAYIGITWWRLDRLSPGRRR
jgi:hypothetical protein